MKALYYVLKDHKNPMIQDLINSSYEHCCREEMEFLVGDGDLLDSDNCGTESAARVCLVNPSFNAALQLAVKKLQDAKLVIDQFGFSPEYLNSAQENDETRLSDKLTVLINDIGIAMKSMEYALFRGKIYKKCPMAKFTYAYKCEVKAFINCLAANESFKSRLLQNMRKVIDVLAEPDCEVIRPICVDYNLIEVNSGQCWSVKERCFLSSPIPEEKIGLVTPRAFVKYESSKEPDAKYFREILQNSLNEAEIGEFCEDFLRLLNFNQKRHKDRVPCLVGDANSGKTSLFLPILALVHHSKIATVTKQRAFNKAMITKATEVIFIDEASTSTMDIDDWKILTQGGYTACDVKYQTARSFINRCPMLITAQQKLQFKAEDQPAMDRRLRNYTFKSLPAPKKRAADWLRKHPMECVAWAAKHARRAEEEEDTSENSDEQEVDQDMENDDGILPEAEKEALRKMVLVDVLADPSQETGDEEVLGSEHGRGEELDGLNEAPSIAALRQIIEECSPMSLRHRQAARVLEKRLDDNVRMQDWNREAHRQRQQQLMARGVTREHADMLPEDASDPLPTPIMEDLADFRRQSLREDIVTRRAKAREAFQGPWLQSTERELHETTLKLLTADVDSQARASLEAYQLLLQDKLKQHHQNLGFNRDCTITLEERKRACVALGLLSKEHRDLITTLFQPLPTVDVVGEPSEVASKNATPSQEDHNEENSDNEDQLFITPVQASPVPTSQVRSTAPVRLRSTSKRKKKRSCTGNVENAGKKPRNSILNYFLSQN